MRPCISKRRNADFFSIGPVDIIAVVKQFGIIAESCEAQRHSAVGHLEERMVERRGRVNIEKQIVNRNHSARLLGVRINSLAAATSHRRHSKQTQYI